LDKDGEEIEGEGEGEKRATSLRVKNVWMKI